MGLSQYKGLGKFEGELRITEYAWRVVQDGIANEFGSIVENGEFYSCLEGPFVPEKEDVEECELTEGDIAYLKTTAGVILREDDQEFVWGRWYETKEGYDAAEARIEAEFAGDED